MTWARWTGKWHRERADLPRLAMCGFNLALVMDERAAPPIVDPQRTRYLQSRKKKEPTKWK